MIVRVLGSAAGGGVPQWNCACANCAAVRHGDAPARSQSSFAVSAAGERWWLVNVSPDIAQQIEAEPSLQPRTGRGTPIAGIFLTDANIDHIGGLAVLRQSGSHRFTIYSSPEVREIALTQPMCAPFFEAPHEWRTLDASQSVDVDGLRVQAIPVDGLTPGYAGRTRTAGAVVGYRVSDISREANAVFAPVFASVNAELLDAVTGADLAFVDGSFWSDDELASVGVPKASSSLGHLPMSGASGSMQALHAAATRTAISYCHLNNTNPVLDERSDAARLVADGGFTLAFDGQEIVL